MSIEYLLVFTDVIFRCPICSWLYEGLQPCYRSAQDQGVNVGLSLLWKISRARGNQELGRLTIGLCYKEIRYMPADMVFITDSVAAENLL